MTLGPNQPQTLLVSVDHGQLMVFDRDSEIDIDAYDSEAQADGLAVWPGGVAVFCDSHWTSGTTVTITLVDEQPSIELAACDHVVIAGLACPSGELRVFAPEETGMNERGVLLPPGDYGLAVCGDQFGTGDQHGDNGDDRYMLTLWPCSDPPPRHALKLRSAGV